MQRSPLLQSLIKKNSFFYVEVDILSEFHKQRSFSGIIRLWNCEQSEQIKEKMLKRKYGSKNLKVKMWKWKFYSQIMKIGNTKVKMWKSKGESENIKVEVLKVKM